MSIRHPAPLRLAELGLLLVIVAGLPGCQAPGRGAARAPDAAGTAAVAWPISARDVGMHVEFLASDALQGRDAGKPSADAAAAYIAAQFERFGLSPVPDGSATTRPATTRPHSHAPEMYEMEFELIGGAGDAAAELRIGRERFAGASAVTAPSCSAAREVTAHVVPQDRDPYMGDFVLAEDTPRSSERRVAKELFEKEAGGVIFVSDKPLLELASGRGLFGMFGGGGNTRLSGPVVRVCQAVGARLREALEKDEDVTLRITRPGRDKSCNVLAFIPGSDPRLKDEYVILGAHYDHIGLTRSGEVCHGADDNASGTAGMLGVAQGLAQSGVRPKRSIILVAWSAEEKGLIGSGAFGRQPPVPLEKIVAYVNLDMIGRNNPHELETGDASETLGRWAAEAARARGFTPKPISAGFLSMSDTAIFVHDQIPTVFLHSGMHGELHRPADRVELIDADKIARTAQAACDLICRIANEPQRPQFTAPQMRPGGEEESDDSADTRPRLGVYAGMLGGGDDEAPAEVAPGNGVRIDGVVPNSIAAKAGMKAGDTLIRIGGQKIEQMGQIRDALANLPAGQPFEIEVRRGARGQETVVLHGTIEAR